MQKGNVGLCVFASFTTLRGKRLQIEPRCGMRGADFWL